MLACKLLAWVLWFGILPLLSREVCRHEAGCSSRPKYTGFPMGAVVHILSMARGFASLLRMHARPSYRYGIALPWFSAMGLQNYQVFWGLRHPLLLGKCATVVRPLMQM
jgi:hypothetical protein